MNHHETSVYATDLCKFTLEGKLFCCSLTIKSHIKFAVIRLNY